MSNRNGLSLFLVFVALVCLGWAIKSPAAVAEPVPGASPPLPRCSQALANKNGIPAAKRVEPVSSRAPERHCASALRRGAASPS
jgi:hypothetical protein